MSDTLKIARALVSRKARKQFDAEADRLQLMIELTRLLGFGFEDRIPSKARLSQIVLLQQEILKHMPPDQQKIVSDLAKVFTLGDQSDTA